MKKYINCEKEEFTGQSNLKETKKGRETVEINRKKKLQNQFVIIILKSQDPGGHSSVSRVGQINLGTIRKEEDKFAETGEA